jgi:hypothetical protein
MSSRPILAIIVLFALIIVLIVLVILYLSGILRPVNKTSYFVTQLLNSITLQQGFCDPSGNCNGTPTNDERGQCQLYQTFSNETEIVDKLQPIALVSSLPRDFQCTDGFTQGLQKMNRTCHASKCLGLDGNIYTQGQIETYYRTCGNLKPCNDPRSALVFNFDVDTRGKLVSEARCLNANISGGTTTYSVTTCPQEVTLSNNVFLNIDQEPVTADGSVQLVRIRAPGSTDCLVINNSGQLYVETCLNRSDEGYSWLFTPQVCTGTAPNLVCYPQQLIQLPPNANTLFPKGSNPTPAQIITALSPYPSLQFNGSNVGLGPYTGCKNFTSSKNGPPQPIDTSCTVKSAIVTAYTWEQLVG